MRTAWNTAAVALNKANPAYIWSILDAMTYPFSAGSRPFSATEIRVTGTGQ